MSKLNRFVYSSRERMKIEFLRKNKTFLKVKTTLIFRVKKLDALFWDCLGNQVDLSTESFDLNCSVL